MNEYNNSINSLTSFTGTHTRRAASPLCPSRLRPLLKSYMPVKNFKFQLFLISLLALASCAKETRVEERLVFWKSELYKIIPTGTPQEEALNKLK